MITVTSESGREYSAFDIAAAIMAAQQAEDMAGELNECAAHAPQTPAGEWERDGNGLPLGYYVTVRDAGRSGFLLGPYRTHAEALGQVDRGRELALKADPFAHFFAFGTARAPERRTVFGA